MSKRDELIERMEYFLLSAILGFQSANVGAPLLDVEELEERIEAMPQSARILARGMVASVLAKEEELGAIIILDG